MCILFQALFPAKTFSVLANKKKQVNLLPIFNTFLMRHFFLFILLSTIAYSIQAQPIAKSEKVLIRDGKPNEVMRITQVTDKDDLVILRTPSRDIPSKSRRFWKRLASRMLATVSDPDNQGVGIAAPQVGINRNMIIVQRFDKQDHPFETYINPVIIATGDSLYSQVEGCLSIPYVRNAVIRYWEVVIRYQDKRMRWHEEKIKGYTARIFQHEIDHLNGILFTDLIRYD